VSAPPHTVITGAAGLVGQNLIPRLKGQFAITAIDKHAHNVDVLRQFHPDIQVIEADLAEAGAWEDATANADAFGSVSMSWTND